ncbi:MAG: hypothetical protein ACRDYX_03970 [Egibacteraceae bacterium]
MASTVEMQQQCPVCGGTGAWERKAQVRPCEEGLCVYVDSKDGVTLDEVAGWIAEIGGQSTAWAYGYLVNAAAKGLLKVEDTDGLKMGERPVLLTEFGHQVVQVVVDTAR